MVFLVLGVERAEEEQGREKIWKTKRERERKEYIYMEGIKYIKNYTIELLCDSTFRIAL